MEGLSFRIKSTPILSDVTFRGESGVLVVTGPNGSGKSTLLRVLATVLPVPSGMVALAGHDIGQRGGARHARPLLSYLPQSTPPVSRMRARDWLEYGAWLASVPKRERSATLSSAIAEWQLEPLLKTPMKSLSVGQRRRMDLARALMVPRRVYLLDEPFAALDANYRDLAMRNLSRLGKEALVVVTDPEHHDALPVLVDLAP